MKMFMAVEGVDRAGKTTQIKLLTRILTLQSFKIGISKSFQFPGGKFLTNLSRIFMRDRPGTKFTDVLFFFAALVQSIQIKYRLLGFDVVMADRWIGPLLTYYRGIKHWNDRSLSIIEKVCSLSLRPDLVIVIEINEEETNRRAKDLRCFAYHYLMRMQYRRLAKEKRWHLIDGKRSCNEIHKEIAPLVYGILASYNKKPKTAN